MFKFLSRLLHKYDVTFNWTIFDPPPSSSRFSLQMSKYDRHKILDPLPLRLWRHLWMTPWQLFNQTFLNKAKFKIMLRCVTKMYYCEKK